MKQINLATTIMCMLAVPIISSFNLVAAYGYIGIFLLAIGWEKKKPTGGLTRMRVIFVVVSSFFFICSIWLFISWIQIIQTKNKVDITDVMIIVLAVVALILSLIFLLVSLFHTGD